jgi:flagellar M-ring protein FliF
MAFVAIALIAVFGMIRPAIKAAAPAPLADEKAETVDEVVDDTELLPGAAGMPRLEAPLHNEKLDRARSLARDNPVAVANIVRDWMAGQTAS